MAQRLKLGWTSKSKCIIIRKQHFKIDNSMGLFKFYVQNEFM